jgi:hypothetical protein
MSCDEMRGPTPISLLLCCGIMTATFFHPDRVAAGEVRAGVAQERFVLPQRVPLAGYSHRGGAPSRGIHDPVGVRALVMQDDDTVAALVSCDLLIVDERLFEAVRQRLAVQRLPKDLVLILAATHTHSGPGAYGAKFFEKISMGHFDPQVFEALVQAITQAVGLAHAGLSPVRVVSRTAQTSGLVVNRLDPEGFADGELIVSGFYRHDADEPFALLVNFAAHPTTLGAWNMQISADYPGVVVREIERTFPGAICLFFAGALGDQAPIKSGSGFEPMEGVGRQVSQQAVALLEGARPASSSALHARQERLALPPAQVRLGRLTFPRWLGQRFVDDDATLSVLAVGNTVFIGAPCDLSASLGTTLKQAAQARGLSPMIIGLASDYIGYCLPASLYEAKAYEASMAFNGPKAGELIVGRLTQMIDEIVTRDMVR